MLKPGMTLACGAFLGAFFVLANLGIFVIAVAPLRFIFDCYMYV